MKNIFRKKTNPKIITTIIIIGVIVFGITMPIFAHASIWTFLGIDSAAKSLIIGIGTAINHVLSWIVKAGSAFFEGMLSVGFNSATMRVIQDGWEKCRDFANMLFILFMVIIAFATILRIEGYGIKKLLPKVIIIALLINFSMVISLAIVDLTNITANVFMNDVRGKINGNEQGKISAVFADSFFGGVTKTYKNCDEFKTESSSLCKDKDFLKAWHVNESICLAAATKGWESCQKTGSFTATLAEEDMLSFLDLFLQYTASSIVLIIAAFTFFAGGIMILFRVIAIWMLVIISPLALICYILPSLNSNWKKWWSTFLNWCIFAPVYTFFIWIAIKIATSGANENMGNVAQIQGSTPMGSWSAISSELVSNPGAKLISYLVIVGFLVGGIIVSRQLGIIGSKTVMNLATGARKKATDWAKRTAMRPVKMTGSMAGAGVLNRVGKLFGGRIGGRMQTRATMLRQAWWESDPKYKKFAKVMTKSGDNTVLSYLSAKGPKGIMAAQELLRRSQLTRTMSVGHAKQAEEKIRSIGDAELLQKFKELRPDVIENNPEMNNVADKLAQEGNLNKVAAVALEDDRFVAAVNKFSSAVQIDSLAKTSPQHGKAFKGTLDRLTDPTTPNPVFNAMAVADQEKIHRTYASQTGDTARISNLAILADLARTGGPDGLKKINTINPAHIATIANNIPSTQLATVIEKMEDSATAKRIVDYLRNDPTASPANRKVATTNHYLISIAS